MLDVVRFWLDLGLDGFRLDAVPYLFERDGTNGENLPETHEYLRRLRKVVDDEFPGRVLLAEANQWPADVVDYFGDGDECHMCFHFPLMPRMFMAVRREQRYPITEILAQTPAIPDGCQWGIFLRNHDELTLEMVTDEERDYMYAEYAKDPRMRRNVGIAPPAVPAARERPPGGRAVPRAALLACRAARSSTTATRSGWATTSTSATATACARRCSGRPTATPASRRADFAQLYLPPLMDPVYGYQAVNVEAEQRDPSSFLHWLRRMLEVRREHPVFGTGTFEVLARREPVGARLRAPAHRRRRRRGHRARASTTSAGSPSRASCMLGHWPARRRSSCSGRVPFPPIGELPYFVTLPPYGFYWFELVERRRTAT